MLRPTSARAEFRVSYANLMHEKNQNQWTRFSPRGYRATWHALKEGAKYLNFNFYGRLTICRSFDLG